MRALPRQKPKQTSTKNQYLKSAGDNRCFFVWNYVLLFRLIKTFTGMICTAPRTDLNIYDLVSWRIFTEILGLLLKRE